MTAEDRQLTAIGVEPPLEQEAGAQDMIEKSEYLPATVDDPAHERLKELARVLETAARSGMSGVLPKGITNKFQIYVILKMGQELGLPEMYSLSNITLIQGRPYISAQAMQAMAQRGGYGIVWDTSTDERASVTLIQGDGDRNVLPQVTWTMDDAKRAGLADKDNWKRYPRQMLRARAIAEAVRMHAAHVIGGAYVPDEIGEQTPDEDLLEIPLPD